MESEQVELAKAIGKRTDTLHNRIMTDFYTRETNAFYAQLTKELDKEFENNIAMFKEMYKG